MRDTKIIVGSRVRQYQLPDAKSETLFQQNGHRDGTVTYIGMSRLRGKAHVRFDKDGPLWVSLQRLELIE